MLPRLDRSAVLRHLPWTTRTCGASAGEYGWQVSLLCESGLPADEHRQARSLYCGLRDRRGVSDPAPALLLDRTVSAGRRLPALLQPRPVARRPFRPFPGVGLPDAPVRERPCATPSTPLDAKASMRTSSGTSRFSRAAPPRRFYHCRSNGCRRGCRRGPANPCQSSAAVTATRLARSAGLAAAQRPVMGYNTWYQYDRPITEADVLTPARAMKSRGLQAAGQPDHPRRRLAGHHRGPAEVRRQPDVEPGRVPARHTLAARQLHGLGFKLGIYGDRGS